jgi:hypothetical protein
MIFWLYIRNKEIKWITIPEGPPRKVKVSSVRTLLTYSTYSGRGKFIPHGKFTPWLFSHDSSHLTVFLAR